MLAYDVAIEENKIMCSRDEYVGWLAVLSNTASHLCSMYNIPLELTTAQSMKN